VRVSQLHISRPIIVPRNHFFDDLLVHRNGLLAALTVAEPVQRAAGLGLYEHIPRGAMIFMKVRHVERFAEWCEEIELDGQKWHACEAHLAARGNDHCEVALCLVIHATRCVALKKIGEVGASCSDDSQLVRASDLVELRHRDVFDVDLARPWQQNRSSSDGSASVSQLRGNSF